MSRRADNAAERQAQADRVIERADRLRSDRAGRVHPINRRKPARKKKR